ncbi:MAG: putative CAMK family protein kinase [Streblomastix strix]|uniref:mitogen-activated protein kinase kinase n=1 Tax=Streblomastix strix TaxID=222440 RepID=A0A5J4X6G4_9EUKA|nr:MAG: putative CAMK family protein kinase [Streblomastix strix]
MAKVEDYVFTREIGEGLLGKVKLCNQLESGGRQACKLIPYRNIDDRQEIEKQFAQIRVFFLRSSQIPSKLVETLQQFYDDQFIYLTMEYFERGSLKKQMSDTLKTRRPFQRNIIYKNTLDIAQSLQSLYELGIVHGNLKPSNCLLTTDGTYKLSDFGLAELIYNRKDLFKIKIETLSYISPEILSNEQASFKSDIYSLGIIDLKDNGEREEQIEKEEENVDEQITEEQDLENEQEQQQQEQQQEQKQQQDKDNENEQEQEIDLKKGKVKVTVIGVKDVTGVDSNGKSDPFIVVKIGTSEFKTKKVKNVLNAEYNETFEFDYNSNATEDKSIHFELWDYDTFSDNDQIGKLDIPV